METIEPKPNQITLDEFKGIVRMLPAVPEGISDFPSLVKHRSRKLATIFDRNSIWSELYELTLEEFLALFIYHLRRQAQQSSRSHEDRSSTRGCIENFRLHDLRHTWTSWLTQSGVPLNVVQEMGAWESSEMMKRYADLALEQFAQHASMVDDMLNSTNLAQQK